MSIPDQIIAPRKALNKAFLKQRVLREDIERFKNQLRILLKEATPKISEASAENLFRDFLLNTYYRGHHHINKHDRMDMVIYSGNSAKSDIQVIIEAKAPGAGADMIAKNKLNAKAFQQLIFYYLKERITNKNIGINHLIVTNVHEWFIFDAVQFEEVIYGNRNLRKDFEAYQLDDHKTTFFFKEVAAKYIDNLEDELKYVHFDLKKYKSIIEKEGEDDVKLIALYKILSPEHLLKKPFANDSNQLDKPFYNELLHIIGLEEISEGSKKIIRRKKEKDNGSLLENTINILKYEISSSKLLKHGDDQDSRLYNAALELCITWINRILFLKLLESQLISYHKGDKSYRFLNYTDINNYDALNKLFFQVLSVKPERRRETLADKYKRIPYLNSSLFEPSVVESETIRISNLEDDPSISPYSKTILKKNDGKRRTGNISALEYLFEFLDSYDFSSEGSESIQEENKTLINASVLGLIFEKINGYKDGSIVTPGFITMYMCKETLHRIVVKKFNEVKEWDCSDVDDLKEKIDYTKEGRKNANNIINDIKICDPAVGSGHFLVSMLNEMISLKSKLGILSDRDGGRIRHYRAEVVNDELMIIDEENDKIFEYKVSESGRPIPELQQSQEMLFHEKEKLIEGCLFGVDINPNSVKICRLRLWIELLKNAYYTSDSDYLQLETLPNIDINIKCGNSLVSRVGLDANLKKALRKSNYSITAYKLTVQNYKDATDKVEKAQFKQLINTVKNDFKKEVADRDLRSLQKLEGEFYERVGQSTLIEVELTTEEKKKREKEIKKLNDKIEKKKNEIEEIKDNRIYENALEWRFECPEVLNENGAFVGFDVVIGNPPYIRQEEFKEWKPYLQNQFSTYSGTADLYVYFVEQGHSLLRGSGEISYIIPNKWMRARYGSEMRQYIKAKKIHKIIDFGDLPVFDGVTTYPLILSTAKCKPSETFTAAEVETIDFVTRLEEHLIKSLKEVSLSGLMNEGWTLNDIKVQELLKKIMSKGVPLSKYVNGNIYRGVVTGLNEAFVIDQNTKDKLIKDDPKSVEIIKPFLAGKNIKRYKQPNSNKYLIFTRRGINIEKYPAILEYLSKYRVRLEPKPKNYVGNKWKGRKPGSYKWYEIQDAVDYFAEFEKEKILWPGISDSITSFALDINHNYGNDNNQMIINNSTYLLGILNSKVSKFYLKNTCDFVRGGFARLKIIYVEKIPIVRANEILKDQIDQLVSNIINLKNEKEDKKKFMENEVDVLAYQIYGLTDDEIEIVETAIA